MMKWNRGLLAAGLILSAACGSEDDSGGGSGGGSYTAIADAIAMPTGTVDATSAPAIAEEFEKISTNGAGKSRPKQSTAAQACPAGGSIKTDVQGNEQSAAALITYEDCCYEAACCMNGGGTWYYSTTSGAEYTYCADYDITMDCGGETGTTSVSYEGCFSPSGMVYVIRVAGKSYAVTGQYSNGNGSLEITGENGSFSCTYTDGAGSCTSSSGEFSF